VLDHRQFGRVFVLSIGEASHEATTAPVSGGTGWQSRQAVLGRSRGVGWLARSGCRWRGPCWRGSITGSSSGSSSSRSVKPATRRQRRQHRVVLGGDRRQAVPGRRRDSAPADGRACRGLVVVSGCWPWRSNTGSSSGSSFSRLVKPATRRRRRQRQAVLGGDRPASGARSKARQRTGGQSGSPWLIQLVRKLLVTLAKKARLVQASVRGA